MNVHCQNTELESKATNLSGILLREPVPEPVVVLDVLVPVLELIEGRLEDFDGQLLGNIQRNLGIVRTF